MHAHAERGHDQYREGGGTGRIVGAWAGLFPAEAGPTNSDACTQLDWL
jgi:hypothetical protein